MGLNYLFLSLCVSIDSLGIGITYGLKKTEINFLSKILLFVLSFLVSSFSIFIGNILINIFPDYIIKLLGSLILIFIGGWIIYQATCNKNIKNIEKKISKEKIHTLFIKWLGITIQIIRHPISSDLDHSKKIDCREAVFLGIALSLDSLCIGIGSSLIGINSFIFPILVSAFQLIFLSFGRFLGSKISNISCIPENTWNIISGVILIIIGIIKFI